MVRKYGATNIQWPLKRSILTFADEYVSNQKVANFFPLCECNRAPMSVHYMTKFVGYWTKVLQMPNERYPRQCYLMLRRLHKAGRRTWATYVKDMLYGHGYGHAWLAQDVRSRFDFMKLLIERVNDRATISVLSQVENSPKADHYKHFKTQLNVERYLCVNLPFKLKRLLANLRCSGHNLMIEKVRHQNIDRQFRCCPICLFNSDFHVEDEFHMLLVCTLYDELRTQCFLQIWLNCEPNVELFYTILSEESSIFCFNKFHLQSV